MKRAADRLASAIDRISWAAGIAAAGGIFAMMVITAYEVVLRYALDRPTRWVTEVAGYLLVFVSIVGATYALRQRGHVAVELLVQRFSPRARVVLGIISSALALLFVAVLIGEGWDMAMTSRRLGFEHIGELGTPQWFTEILIPIGGILLALEFLRQIYHSLLSLGAPGKG